MSAVRVLPVCTAAASQPLPPGAPGSLAELECCIGQTTGGRGFSAALCLTTRTRTNRAWPRTPKYISATWWDTPGHQLDTRLEKVLQHK